MDADDLSPRRELVTLLAGKGFPRDAYALFWMSGEGASNDPDTDDASGYLIDHTGAVYYFWLEWHGPRGLPALTEWEPVVPEADWGDDREYREARQRVRLSD